MELLRNVIKVGPSHAVVIPYEYFQELAAKGKIFYKVKIKWDDKGLKIKPILEELDEKNDNKTIKK